MTPDERIADFCFSGANAITFTVIGGVLTGALSGQYANFDREGILLICGIVAGLGLLAVVLLINGWIASSKHEQAAAKKVSSPSPFDWNCAYRGNGREILLYTPVEQIEHVPTARVSVEADIVDRVVLALSFQRGR